MQSQHKEEETLKGEGAGGESDSKVVLSVAGDPPCIHEMGTGVRFSENEET